MRIKYIMFTQEMARAYREGRKKMTRRVVKLHNGMLVLERRRHAIVCTPLRDGIGAVWTPAGGDPEESLPLERLYAACPYGQPGDQLILGTTWAVPEWMDPMKPSELPVEIMCDRPIPIWSYFDGDEKPEGFGKLRPGMFLPGFLRDRMPTETLKIVRAERVQEITLDDIYAEGAITEEWEEWREDAECVGLPPGSHIENERDVFEGLWDSINLKRGYGWESNPWIWVLGW